MTHSKLWLLKAYPDPEYIPAVHDIVLYVPTGTRALIISAPTGPDPETFDFDSLSDDQMTRPYHCSIMLGEDKLDDVDVSKFTKLT